MVDLGGYYQRYQLSYSYKKDVGYRLRYGGTTDPENAKHDASPEIKIGSHRVSQTVDMMMKTVATDAVNGCVVL